MFIESFVYIRIASHPLFPALLLSLPRFPQRARDSHCQIVFEPHWVRDSKAPIF